MSAKQYVQEKKNLITIENIIFILFCILIIYPPFMQGLFFEEEILPTLLYSCVIFVAWYIYKIKDRGYKIVKTHIDLLFIGIVFMYMISIFYGVNKRASIFQFMKYVVYLNTFMLSRDLLRDEKKCSVFMNFMLLSAFAVSVIGIGSAIGVWEYADAYISGRISSTFQYPNTLAAYLAAMYFLGLGQLINEDRKTIKGLYGVILSTLLFTFVLTYSRGMWLLFPLMMLVYFIFLPVSRKVETLVYFISSLLVTLPAAFLFSESLDGQVYKSWLIYLVATIVTGFIIYLVSNLRDKFRSVSVKRLAVYLIVVFLVLVAIFTYIFNITMPLVFENSSNEDKWLSVSRDVNKVFPNSKYELKVSYVSKNDNQKPFAGRIIVYNIDNNGELKQVALKNIVETQKGEIKIPFETESNTAGARTYFQNLYAGTSITFLNATIIDNTEKNIEYNIPLKYKYLPESIISRLNSINLKENSAQARLAFYKDAFKVVKDYIIFGAGGGAWSTIYQRYQSYPYWTKLEHNYFIQTWIEVGILGLLMLIGVLVSLSIALIRKYRKLNLEKGKLTMISLYIAAFTILIHSFLDFDLSFVSLSLILWSVIGILYSFVDDVIIGKWVLTVDAKKSKSSSHILPTSILILITIFVGALSSSFTISNKYSQKAYVANEAYDVDGAIEYMTKAHKLDKYKTSYIFDLSSLYEAKYKVTQDNSYIFKSKEYIDRYYKIGKQDPSVNANTSLFYLKFGYIDEALDLMDKTVELQPMIVESYLQKCNEYLAAFNYYYFQRQEYEKAKEVLERALKVKEDIKKINSRALKPLNTNEDLVYKIGEIQFYNENFDEINNILGKGYSLNFVYYFDLDINNDGNIDMLYTWSTEGGNAKYDYMEDQKDKFIRITNDGEKYGIVYPYGIKLEPNTEYLIQFDARGTVGENKFDFYVIDSEAKNKQFGGLENIKLTNDWETYELKITTDPDAAPGKQYLRFQHNGSDNGYIDLRKVVIFKK